jgi:hypothetical protein
LDEISQGPKRDFRLPFGRWLVAAAAAGLIAAAAVLVVTGTAGRHAALREGAPSVPPAPASLTATVLARIPLPVSRSSNMTLLGSTAWISDWSTGKVVGVDLATRRIIRTLHIRGQQDGPVSMASGAGSVWVLDLSGSLLRIDAATGITSKRILVRGAAADVAYGDGYVWVITNGPDRNGAEEHLYKIDPSRNVIAKDAPIPGSGPRCVASPGPQGVWIGCGGAAGITLIDPGSLKPVESVPVDIGEYAGRPIGVPGLTPQIAPGRKVVWVLTPAGLVRVDPAAARITATVHIGYDLRAMSVPALTVDRAGRVWIAGSLLNVLLPGTLAVHQVGQTAGSRSVAADGQSVWVDTGRTLVGLDVNAGATR